MQLAEEIRYLLLAVQREGNRTLSEALAPLGLTPSQAEVLRVLQDYQPISLGELGGLLVCESGSPSRLVNGLVTAGFVQRVVSPQDRRYVTLTLTPLGAERAEQIVAIETVLHRQIEQLIEDVPIDAVKVMLWRYIDNRPAGKALARRSGRSQRSHHAQKKEVFDEL